VAYDAVRLSFRHVVLVPCGVDGCQVAAPERLIRHGHILPVALVPTVVIFEAAEPDGDGFVLLDELGDGEHPLIPLVAGERFSRFAKTASSDAGRVDPSCL